MAGSIYEILIRQTWDTSSLRAYASEVTSVIAKIEAAAKSGQLSGSAKQSAVSTLQSTAQGALVTQRDSGAISQAQFERESAQLQRRLTGLTTSIGDVALLNEKELSKSATKAISNARKRDESADQVLAAEQKADEKRIRNAEASGTRADRRGAAPGGTVVPIGGGEQAEFDFSTSAARATARQEALSLALLQNRAAKVNLEQMDGETSAELRVRVGAEEAATRARERIAIQDRILANEHGELDAKIQAELGAKQLARVIKERVREEELAAGIGGGGGAAEAGGLKGFLSKQLGTLTQGGGLFAVGLTAYQGVQAIKNMIEQAEKLQVQLGFVKAQFNAIGEGDQYGKFRDDLLEIARDTGVAGDEAAQVGRIMKAAFGDSGIAISNTKAALEAMQVTGLSAAEAENILVATTKSFGLEGADAISQVTDEALHLQDVFGVNAKEVESAVANIGALANEVGLTVKQTSAVVAGAVEASGRPATQVASELSRTLPQIQKNVANIVSLYSQPNLKAQLPTIASDINQGNYGQVLLQLLRDTPKMTEAQRANTISILGGSRAAGTLAAAFKEADKIIGQVDDTSDHSGRTAQQLAEYHKTLKFHIDQAREAFRQLGAALVEAGVADSLGNLVSVGTELFRILGGLIGLFGDINTATHGWLGTVIELTLAIKAFSAVSKISIGENTLGALLSGGLLGRGAAGAGAASATFAGEGAIGGAFTGGRGLLAKAGLGVAGAGSAATSALASNPYTVIAAAAIATIVTYQNQSEEAKKKAESDVKKASDAALKKSAESNKTLAFEKNIIGKTLDVLGVGISFPASLAGKDISPSRSLGLDGYSPDQAAAQLAKRRADAARQQIDLVNAAQKQEASDRQLSLAERERLKGLSGIHILSKTSPDPKDLDPDQFTKAASILADIGTKGLGPKRLKDIVDKANAGDQVYIAIVKALKEIYADRPGELAKLQALLDQGKEAPKTPDVKAQDAVSKASEVEQLYQAGAASAAEYVASLNEEIAGLQLVGSSDTSLKELPKLLAKKNKFLSDQARQAADLRIQAAEAGGDTGDATLTELTALLKSKTFTDPADRFKAAHDLITAQQKIANATKQAVAFVPGEREALLQEQIDVSPQILAFEQGYTAVIKTFGDDFHKKLAELVASGKTINQAYEILFDQQDKDLRAQLAAISGGFGGGSGLSGRRTAARRAALAAAIAGVDAARADVSGADLGPTPTEPDAVQPAAPTADELAAEAKAIRKAKLDLAKAQAGNNAVELAKAAQEEARQAAEDATKESEKIEAEAQRIAADRQFQDAIANVFNSQTDLAIAVANAAGDTVKAAQLGAKEAQDKLNQALAQGSGEDVINNLQAGVVSARATAVQTQLSEEEANIEFMKEMNRITTTQEIAYYENLKKIPGLNEKQLREIELKIYQLRKELSADLQFNIPQDIQLPTLYEARRLYQSNQAGIGYQGNRSQVSDNRTITLQMNVNNQTDYQGAFDTFRGIAVEPSSQYGTQGSLYSGA